METIRICCVVILLFGLIQPSFASAQMRTWTNASGEWKFSAEFLQIENGLPVIVHDDDRQFRCQKERFNVQDQMFLDRLEQKSDALRPLCCLHALWYGTISLTSNWNSIGFLGSETFWLLPSRQEQDGVDDDSRESKIDRLRSVIFEMEKEQVTGPTFQQKFLAGPMETNFIRKALTRAYAELELALFVLAEGKENALDEVQELSFDADLIIGNIDDNQLQESDRSILRDVMHKRRQVTNEQIKSMTALITGLQTQLDNKSDTPNNGEPGDDDWGSNSQGPPKRIHIHYYLPGQQLHVQILPTCKVCLPFCHRPHWRPLGCRKRW